MPQKLTAVGFMRRLLGVGLLGQVDSEKSRAEADDRHDCDRDGKLSRTHAKVRASDTEGHYAEAENEQTKDQPEPPERREGDASAE